MNGSRWWMLAGMGTTGAGGEGPWYGVRKALAREGPAEQTADRSVRAERSSSWSSERRCDVCSDVLKHRRRGNTGASSARVVDPVWETVPEIVSF